MSEDWSGEVEDSKPALTDKQVRYLLEMTKAIREAPYIGSYISQIKEALGNGMIEDAQALWADLDQGEQTALWVAPSYGGVFTTEERELLKFGGAA